MPYKYNVIHSSRRTLSVEINSEGQITVRAPYRMSDRKIEKFISDKAPWIEKQLAKLETARRNLGNTEKLSDAQINSLIEKAKAYIPARADYYAEILGVEYGRITVRSQKTKWGSCSSKGNLNFNCLLMLAPAEVIDSVVVHELCHLKYMNHSKEFYSEVLAVFPKYKSCDKWLKDNGRALMSRLGK